MRTHFHSVLVGSISRRPILLIVNEKRSPLCDGSCMPKGQVAYGAVFQQLNARNGVYSAIGTQHPHVKQTESIMQVAIEPSSLQSSIHLHGVIDSIPHLRVSPSAKATPRPAPGSDCASQQTNSRGKDTLACGGRPTLIMMSCSIGTDRREDCAYCA